MGAIYIGGHTPKNSGIKWKLYLFLFLFLMITGGILKLTGAMLVERWINENGAGKNGYAFSIRDVELSLAKGQMTLKDVKIFNPKTATELLEAPILTIQMNVQEFILSQQKLISVFADKVELILSKDFSSEIARVQTEKQSTDLYLDMIDGKITELKITEKKVDQSRTVIELNDVNLKVKEVALHSINKKTEFNVTSNIADGGKLNLTGKMNPGNAWTIQGALKQVPTDIFNKMAGDKLPFTFNESRLNADIVAQSENGKVSGEIAPEVKRLNLVEEKPGIPTQSIARALTDELTFTLPFTIKDELTLEYEETFRKLKTYRKYPASIEEKVSEAPKAKKEFSLWPF